MQLRNSPLKYSVHTVQEEHMSCVCVRWEVRAFPRTVTPRPFKRADEHKYTLDAFRDDVSLVSHRKSCSCPLFPVCPNLTLTLTHAQTHNRYMLK